MKAHVKKGDQVEITVGPKGVKGNKGLVLAVNAAKGQVVVEGGRKITKAVKPTEANPSGGLVQVDGPVHISNVKKLS